jgi:hypothetical protein
MAQAAAQASVRVGNLQVAGVGDAAGGDDRGVQGRPVGNGEEEVTRP